MASSNSRYNGSNFNPYQNMFHSERLSTFLEAKWPNTDSSFLYLCTPQKLAQAGLEFYAKGEGRCVVCLCIVKNLEATSDPWIRHANLNPDCPLILLGKPIKPDHYTLEQWMDLIQHRERKHVEQQFEEAKRQVVKRMTKLVLANSESIPAGVNRPKKKDENLNETVQMMSDSDSEKSDVDM